MSVFYFPIEDCLNAISRGKPWVFCCGIPTRFVRIDKIAPDLVFSDLPVISPDAIEIQTELGSGGYGVVWKGLFSINQSTTTPDISADQQGLLTRDDSQASSLLLHSRESSNSLLSMSASSPTKRVTVAVKEMHSTEFESNADQLEKFAEFRKEAYIHSCLRHKNLVRLFGICLLPRLRMVLEFMDHGDLYHLLKAHDKYDDIEQFPFSVRLNIAIDVAKGMTYLHSLNPPIVHCDLRSPNIFLKRRTSSSTKQLHLRAKVADFGLSRRIFSDATSGFLGTWQWLPPEVIEHGEFTELADVYSFGVIMWELISRQYPFQKEADAQHSDIVGLKKAIVKHDLRPSLDFLDDLPFKVPNDYLDLMKQCWIKKQSKRPSFLEITMVLARIAQDLEIVDTTEKILHDVHAD